MPTVPKVIQMFRATSGDLERRSVDYLVYDVGDEQEAIQAVIDAVPFRLPQNELFVQDSVSVEEMDKKACLADGTLNGMSIPVGGLPDPAVKDGWYKVTVNYINETSIAPDGGSPAPPDEPTPPDEEPEGPDLDDKEVRLKKHTFTQTVENVNVQTNMVGSTTYYTDASGDPDFQPDFSQRGIHPTGEDGEFAGTTVRRPIGSFTITYNPSADDADKAYLAKVKSLVGKVNSEEFYDYEPGEVLFVSCRGKGINDDRYGLEFAFEVRPNLKDQIVFKLDGTQLVYDVDGFDYAWVLYKPAVDSTAVAQDPVQIQVERLYSRTDLNQLFL